MKNQVQEIKKRLECKNTEMIKEVARKLMDDFRDGSIIVFKISLDILESRLDEKEFVEFCNSL